MAYHGYSNCAQVSIRSALLLFLKASGTSQFNGLLGIWPSDTKGDFSKLLKRWILLYRYSVIKLYVLVVKYIWETAHQLHQERISVCNLISNQERGGNECWKSLWRLTLGITYKYLLQIIWSPGFSLCLLSAQHLLQTLPCCLCPELTVSECREGTQTRISPPLQRGSNSQLPAFRYLPVRCLSGVNHR